MASITKNNGENSMAEDQTEDRASDASDDAPEPSAELSKRDGSGYGGGNVVATSSGQARPGGFFHVYKSGQGYWTRMGTVGGAALIILLIGNFLYTYLPTWSDTLHAHPRAMIGIVLGVVAAISLLVFKIINKPTNVDFLIATDSEMKKVNWTSRNELVGSTKIVIIFVLLITVLLFVIDILFGYFFYFVGVLRNKPF